MKKSRNVQLPVVWLILLLFIGGGCGVDAPVPPATPLTGPPPGPADSSIGNTDDAVPSGAVDLPENLPDAERNATTAVLNLGGHIDQASSGHVLTVDLTGTDVGNDDLEQLQDFSQLLGLILTDTGVSDDGLKHVAKLGTLTTLELYRTSISDGGMKHLSNLSSLAGLYLKGTNVTNEGLEHIAGLTNLTQLSLSNTALTDDGLKHLRGLSKLESLMLEDTQVTANGLIENLSDLKKLELIAVAGTQMSAEEAGTIERSLPGIRVTGP
ncbi:MAG: hypothetical protein HON53_03820 [Planctomycetaceae bacterium]|jgi:hypothetical protein|nr:hypothetical protein [Planctomycetaceae bacterium]MBT6154143.1 hypothetical protein [Planctomycetaceae bacterium]MBT6487860.1 hypothetical protein [Planctomycetaceae bacterium]MBT6495678.1 hypothetical protein [Planctomycetaceae bacterium]